MAESLNILLEELESLHSLSVRTVNVCLENKLLDLFSIIDFYLEKGDFLSLSRCGRKSSHELAELSKYYLQNGFLSRAEKKEEITKAQRWHNLSPTKQELIKRYYYTSSLKLSQRSSNAAQTVFNQFNGSIANIYT